MSAEWGEQNAKASKCVEGVKTDEKTSVQCVMTSVMPRVSVHLPVAFTKKRAFGDVCLLVR